MWLLFTNMFMLISCDLRNYIYELWVSSQYTNINFLYIFGAVHIELTFMEKCILKYIYVQCTMLCFIPAYVFLTELIFCRNRSFYQCNSFGFITKVVLTLPIHIIGYSMCHSCNIMNYLKMWLFHFHNDSNISHITDVTISSAIMTTS